MDSDEIEIDLSLTKKLPPFNKYQDLSEVRKKNLSCIFFYFLYFLKLYNLR